MSLNIIFNAFDILPCELVLLMSDVQEAVGACPFGIQCRMSSSHKSVTIATASLQTETGAIAEKEAPASTDTVAGTSCFFIFITTSLTRVGCAQRQSFVTHACILCW